ncbi:MAG: DUF4870 domain-containing protein, partial [Bacteroidota bacterium]
EVDEEPEMESDIGKIKLLNLSVLSVLVIPFGNLILPALLFIRHRSNKTVNQVGRKIISFQIITTVFLFFLTVILFLSIGRGNGAVPLPIFICYALIVAINSFVVIRTAIDIDQQKEVLKSFPNIL